MTTTFNDKEMAVIRTLMEILRKGDGEDTIGVVMKNTGVNCLREGEIVAFAKKIEDREDPEPPAVEEPRGKRFEHFVTSADTVSDAISEHEGDGWGVCAIQRYEGGSDYKVVFKRPVVDPKAEVLAVLKLLNDALHVCQTSILTHVDDPPARRLAIKAIEAYNKLVWR